MGQFNQPADLIDQIKGLEATLNALARQVTRLGAQLRSASGLVASGGTITHGSGFSVVHSSAGTYTITYDTAFDATPDIQATLGATAGLTGVAVTSPSVSGCTVVTFNASGLVDGEFYFTASEPPST